MNAFTAAKRTALVTLAIPLILLSASLSFADDDEKAPFLGVVLQEITTSMGKALQLDDGQGVMVSEIVDDSAADKAGLQDGDVILEFDGKKMESHKQLTRAIRKTSPGDKIELVILRAGHEKKLTVEMGEQEHDVHMQIIKEFVDGEHSPHVMIKTLKDGDDAWTVMGSDRGYMGVHLDNIQDQMADYFGVAETGGALITEVVEDSPAAEAGLKAGDVIIKLDDQEIDSTGALHQAMADTEKDQEVKVQVVRKGDKKTLKVKLDEMDQDLAHLQFFGQDGEFPVRTPKMLFHGQRSPHVQVFRDRDGDDFFEWHSKSDDMDELREELQQLKKELKEMRKELKK